MTKTGIIWLVVIIVIIVGGLLWWFSSMPATSNIPSAATEQTGNSSATTTGTTGTNTSGTTDNTPATPPLTLDTASTGTLGTYLIAANGMTLYKYTPDKPNISNCTGQCAIIWPPYVVSSTDTSTLAVGSSIMGKLGTIKRANGSLQLTYNKIPLYFYSKDKNPGDTSGQGVAGIWFVVAP